MIYDTCSWEVDMIYDTCSWRPLYVEAQHGIRTLWRRDSVWVSDAATMEAEVDAIEKQETQGYCHRRGEHTCGEASSGSVAASAKAAIAKGTTLLTCWRCVVCVLWCRG